MGGPYGGIVELLALTGQRREEVAGSTWDEFDLGQRSWTLPKARTKNAKQHTVHLSAQAIAVLKRNHPSTGVLLVAAKLDLLMTADLQPRVSEAHPESSFAVQM